MTVQYQGVWSLQSAAQLQSTQRWVTDPLYKNTTLLLQADDAANGAQNNTFLDSSSNSFIITRNGNTTQGSFTPFSAPPGTWSNFFNGTSGLRTPSASITNIIGTNGLTTSSVFTAEAWIYLTQYSSSEAPIVGDMNPTGGTKDFALIVNPSGKLAFSWYNGSATLNATGNSTVPLNTWVNVAVTISATTIYLFVDGLLQTLTGNTSNTGAASSTGYIAIGEWNSGTGGLGFNGNISNLRIVKSALYTTSYRPSTAPLTNVANTGLLTCQSNGLTDNSSNAYALTVASIPSVQAFSPFAPQFQWTAPVIGGSGYFDGTGDFLAPTANLPAVSTGQAFTLEMWVYAPAAVVNTNGAGLFGGISNAINFVIGVPSTNNITYGKFGVANIINPGGACSITPGSWNHLVLCRNTSNQTAIFVNGARVGFEGADTNSFVAATYNIANNNGNFFPGYISSLRFVVGTAVHNPTLTTCTVPTSPLTNITNTSLLLNFTNAGIFDGTMKSNVETSGNASINTSVVKYGSGSIFFDGTGDYLTIPNVQQIVGTINTTLTLTIECWIYHTQRPAFQESGLIGDMNPVGATNNWSFGPNQNGFLVWYAFSNATQTATSTQIPLNTWTHIAVSIQSGRIRLFVNGVLQAFTGDAALTTTSGSVGYLAMGQWNNSSNYAYFGYVDDMRITRGVARYITSFIPPSVALPRQ